MVAFDTEDEGKAFIMKEANKLIGGFKQHMSDHVKDRTFNSFFGTTLHITYLLWCLLDVENEGPEGATVLHLLWALMFLKVYATVDVLSRISKVNPVTFRKWTWDLVFRIAGLHHDLASFCVDFLFFYSSYLLTLLFSD